MKGVLFLYTDFTCIEASKKNCPCPTVCRFWQTFSKDRAVFKILSQLIVVVFLKIKIGNKQPVTERE
jgi:hypothetical protein